MSHPLLWPKKTFFYPIGNTPAMRFTDGLAPDDPAEILLLGCGDPRSILYTVFADLGAPQRTLDFTCCDSEPAILTRNILLYTLLADADFSPDKLARIWNIFYHFYLDEDSLELLSSHCRKLLNKSASIEAWNASEYGTFLKFTTDHSFLEIRHHWNLYTKSASLSSNKKAGLKASFSSGMNDVLNRFRDTAMAMAGRSAGPLWMDLTTLGAQHFRQFWTTGVTSSTNNATKPATHINPTFAFSRSGRGFNVHYATDPILSFHLALALAPIKAGHSKAAAGMDDLVKSAKAQFNDWCSAFREKIIGQSSSPSVTVRMFVGDALAFPRALSYCAQRNCTSTDIHASTWSGAQIELDALQYGQGSSSRAPLQFDVIDTSNLADHLGLLNILVVAIPLLRKRPSSVLHTNTLLPFGDKGSAYSAFKKRSCADIMTLSLILGVTPISYTSGFDSHSTIPDAFTLGVNSYQTHECISWRIIMSLRDWNCRLNIDYNQLAKFIFGVYQKMFTDENLATKFSNINLHAFTDLSNVHYTRASLALFLQLVKSRVQTDWDKCMHLFLFYVECDRTLLMGSNSYQDLCCSLHHYGVFSANTMTMDFVRLKVEETRGPFQKWEHVPPVVYVVVEVPRKYLRVLEDMDPDDIQTPILQCETRGATFHNVHASIDIMFGKLQVTNSLGENASITEDPKGWNGNSPLIMSLLVPSWMLTVEPTRTRVGLSIRNTPASALKLTAKLGSRLEIFFASLMDTRHVHVMRERPRNKSGVPMVSTTQFAAVVPDHDCPATTTIVLNGATEATSLIVRVDITDTAGRGALSSNAAATTTQVSRFQINVKIGTFRQELHYPFSMDAGCSKLRIARKSSYVEVEVLVTTSGLPFTLQPFPVSFHDQRPNLWNLHYVNLDRLPSLDLSDVSRLEWLPIHWSLTFSDREREAKESKNQPDRGTLVNMKESIAAIFFGCSGISNVKRIRIFSLCDPENGGIYTLIFVNDMRLDLASRTVVVDACVLCLTSSIAQKIAPALSKLAAYDTLEIITLKDEVIAWKHFLPGIVERCRKWKHLDSCEYISGGFPLSVEHYEDPICGCGRGKNLGTFTQTHSQWKEYAPLVTRIALSPLFAVPFLESAGRSAFSKVADVFSKAGKRQDKCARCDGPGKPRLLVCSRCKETSYCSQVCQREDWKVHKVRCNK